MKILYHGWVRRDYKILNLMKENYDWEPKVVAANPSEKDKINIDYPNAKFVSIPDLRFGERDFFGLKKIPIGQEEFDKISKHFPSFLLSFNDTNNHNFSTKEKIYFSRKLFDYWNTILFNCEIDCVVFYTWPHTTTCFSLYLIAKYVFKKKILFIDVIEHFSKNYHTVSYDLSDFSKPYLKYVNQNHEIEDVNKYIENVKNNSFFKREDHIRFRKVFIEKNIFFKLFVEFIIAFCKGGIFRKGYHDWKVNFKSWNKKNSPSKCSFIFFKFKIAVQTKLLKKFYQRNTSKITSKNYILVSGQYQPEANSTQHVGYYHDFFSVLDLIYSVKDDETEVYYKEHPDTFEHIPVYYTPLYKDKKFWKKILKYKNLKLIDLNEKFRDCVKDAKMVVTLSSTSGMESLIHGKPVLLFSKVWYSACDGVFLIRNYKSCKEAFNKIKNGFKPDFQKVKNFLNSVALSCEKEVMHEKFIKLSKEEHFKSLKKISKLLNKKFKEYYL